MAYDPVVVNRLRRLREQRGTDERHPGGSTLDVRLYLTLRHLRTSKRPCVIARDGDLLLLAVQPGAPRRDVVACLVESLTVHEQNALRAAFGQLPVGQPITDRLLEGHVTFDVPPALRLPQEVDRYPDR